MLSIEDTEKLIAAMRTQAKSLEAGADALQAALAPLKAATASVENWSKATAAMFGLWTSSGYLTGSGKPNKLD